MKPALVAAVLLASAVLVGCGDDGGDDSNTGAAPDSASPSSAPTSQVPDSAVPSADDVEGAETAPVTPDAGGDEASVIADVENLAVNLESFYRGNPYPTTVKEVVASLGDANLSLSVGNSIGGYVYDPSAIEFKLCVEGDDGAYATYDTAPMTVRQSGPMGGCPEL